MMRGLTELFFPRRIGRGSYFLRNLAGGAVAWALTENPDSIVPSERLLWALVLLALTTYLLLYVVRPRVRDCGLNAWVTLLACIPVAGQLFGLILIFKPSRTPLQEYLNESHPEETGAFLPDGPLSVAGTHCSRCGKPLVLETDGRRGNDGAVICNECLAGGA